MRSGSSYYYSQSSTQLPRANGALHHVNVQNGQKLYAPTFDCCATCAKKFGVANQLIADLNQNNVPATFFLTTEWIKAHREDAKKIIATSTFAVGLHGATHTDLTGIDKEILRHEVSGARSFYEALLIDMFQNKQISRELYNRRMDEKLFRFPFGTFDKAALTAAHAAGMTPVQWNGTMDGELSTPDLDQDQKLNGAILLGHANRSNKATRYTDTNFINMYYNLARRGYQAVTVTDLLQSGNPIYTNKPVERDPPLQRVIDRTYADNAKYNFGRSTPTTVFNPFKSYYGLMS